MMAFFYFLVLLVVLVEGASISLQSNSKISSYTLQTKQSLKQLEKGLLALGFIPANIILKEIKGPALEKLPSEFFSTLTAPQMRDLMEAYVMAKQSSKNDEGLGPFHRALQKALEDREIRKITTPEDFKRLGFHASYIPVKKLSGKQLQAFVDDWSGEKTLTQRVQNDLEHFLVSEFVENENFEKCKLPERFLRKLAYVQPPVGWPKPLQQRAERLGLDIKKLQLDSGIALDEDQNTLQNLQIYERNVLQTKNAHIKKERREKKEKQASSSSSGSSEETSLGSSTSISSDEPKKKRKKNVRRKTRVRKELEESSESDLSLSSSSSSERPRKTKGRKRRGNQPRVNQPGGRTVLGRIRSITISDTEQH